MSVNEDYPGDSSAVEAMTPDLEADLDRLIDRVSCPVLLQLIDEAMQTMQQGVGEGVSLESTGAQSERYSVLITRSGFSFGTEAGEELHRIYLMDALSHIERRAGLSTAE